MSVTSGFFNSLSGDRKYDAIQISSMFDGLITDGIYNGFLESFMVTASSPASMVVTVGEGRCWFNHTWTLNDAPLPLTLDAGDVVLNRIDTIVIDVDSTDTVRACTIKVVKGTPSSQAVRPTLENTETHHQYPLCDISVPAGATTITQSNITNRRGTSDCPFVATLMESVDVDDLLIQWESQWNDWMTDRANSMDSWTAEQQEAFTTWFQTVQDILDENTAGNLLNRINHRTGINATATYSEGVVAITAPDDAGEILTFVAPSDFLSTDTYTLNGDALTLTDLNGEAVEDAWKQGAPVTFTISGNKAFFKAGGSGKNDTLPPLLGNMTVEVVEGDENDTYTIKMNKLILDKTTEMVGGAQLEWGEEMPAKPGKGTGGIKTWTREEIITTDKPYDGLYLGDVTPSDTVTETLIYLPENDSGSVKLVPFIVLSTDYLGGVYVMREPLSESMKATWGGSYYYPGNPVDSFLSATYLNSILDKSISDALLTCSVPVQAKSSMTVETMDRKCWVPSYGELYSATFNDGTKMPYFNSTNRIAYINGGKVKGAYWTRTREKGGSPYSVDTSGGMSNAYGWSDTIYIRPSFVLPKDFQIQQRPDGSYTVYNDYGLMTLKDIQASTSKNKVVVNVEETSGPSRYIYHTKNYNETKRALLERENLPTLSTAITTSYESGLATVVTQWCQSNLGSAVQSLVSDVSMTVQTWDGSLIKSSIEQSYFLLSVSEYGTDIGTGTTLPYYSSSTSAPNKIKKYNGSAYKYWLRDLQGFTTASRWYQYRIDTDGAIGYDNGNTSYGYAPAFTLPLTAPIRLLADGTYDLVPEDPALSAQGVSTMDTGKEEVSYISLKDVPETPSVSTQKVIVKVQVENELTNFIAIKKDYGNGGYALLLEQPTEQLAHGDPYYTQGALSTWCTGVFKAKLPSEVQKHLVEATVMSRDGNAEYSIFIPSATELGAMGIEIGNGGTNDGVRFTGFATNNPADRITSPAVSYATRTNAVVNTDIYCVNTQGRFERLSSTTPSFLRPIILLSGDALVTDNGDGTYTFVGDEPVPDSPQVTHTVEVPHGQKVVFRQFTQNQKKQFQTMLVGGVYPPLGDVEPPFALPEFTGNHAIFGDEVAGRIELYESGDLTLSPGTYDIFMVGGGASGGGHYESDSRFSTGGGGSGYTKTILQKIIDREVTLNIVVGAGAPQQNGEGHLAGSETSIDFGTSIERVSGGSNVSSRATTAAYANGTDGGSGAGSNTENAGLNGLSDGQTGGIYQFSYGSRPITATGVGQGTTTRAFGEPEGTLYAGGGAGASPSPSYGRGGAGGGGKAAQDVGIAGTPNTGGGGGGSYYDSWIDRAKGGAGGSGIIIIRWNNA